VPSSRTLLTTVGAIALGQALPSVTAVAHLRRRVTPGLAGVTDAPHVALTFDDGPDPESTLAVAEQLARMRVSATFFVLGEQLAAYPGIGRRLAAAGHELAVHGWRHRPHLLRTPGSIDADLRRTARVITQVIGTRPTHWRPPNGIATTSALLSARRLGLQPVLWTADGRDWRRDASAASICDRVTADLRAGGVVLLHDSDSQSTPGSWRHVVRAIPNLVGYCREHGWEVGPLRDHHPRVDLRVEGGIRAVG
jgi:peptidoglycan/xylan/chitin deacetylase (PgdA/CDA1 family)